MTRRGASDLLIMAGAAPVFRAGGRLLSADAPLCDDAERPRLFASLLTARVRERIESDGAADFSLHVGSQARFRVNLHRQRGTLAAAVRALPSAIPTLSDLLLPATLADLVKP